MPALLFVGAAIVARTGGRRPARIRREGEAKRTIRVNVVASTAFHGSARLGDAASHDLRLGDVPSSTQMDRYGNDVFPSKGPLKAGHVRLRSGKRPRPLVAAERRRYHGGVHEPAGIRPLRSRWERSSRPLATQAACARPPTSSAASTATARGSALSGPTGGLAKPGQTRTYRYYAPRRGRLRWPSAFTAIPTARSTPAWLGHSSSRLCRVVPEPGQPRRHGHLHRRPGGRRYGMSLAPKLNGQNVQEKMRRTTYSSGRSPRSTDHQTVRKATVVVIEPALHQA
jgi:hypothetical protein